jgi:translation initiation factor IF-2
MRIYEFSKKFNVPNKEVLSHLREAGFEVQSHMTLLTPEALSFLEQYYSPKKLSQPLVTDHKIEDTSSNTIPKKAPEETVSIPLERPAQIMAPTFILEPMSVGDFAKRTGQPIGEVILSLLRQGVVATKNQLLTKDIVARLAHTLGIAAIEAPIAEIKERVLSKTAGEKGVEERLPVVAVVGHVDHGKTTLLDFIRKTRLAAKEKGGITQHLGAYEAHTTHGNIVFLDTPGHETFSLMRARGIHAADLAILVVAADDGVMPQTVEAIKLIQRVGIPVIVALNKIDKATKQQVESLKTRLASYGLTPEEWGGQVVMIPLSAKTGEGVDTLLEVIVLQAKLMELTTNLSIPARGFILEAKLEKGRGPVATVICQQGILSVGDYFVCGGLGGKVNSLINSVGARVDKIYPSQPARVAGFSSLPQVGELFEVVSAHELKERLAKEETTGSLISRHALEENTFNIIVKTDSVSSQEALLNALDKVSTKGTKKISVVYAGVGAIKESDINLAADTHSIIYGLHVKAESKLLHLAQREQVTIKLFDIIYKLLEDIQLLIEQGKPVKMVNKKIGEAVVLKVFDIKKIGIIAGAQVKSGRFVKDAHVVIWRGKNKVGEGTLTSLQRDKKTVKEVHTGFECAFVVDSFVDWLVDDRVECYLSVPEA